MSFSSSMMKAVAALLLCSASWVWADDPQLKRRDPLPANGVSEYRVDQGRHIAVKLLTTVSLRTGAGVAHVDLQTVFPVIIAGRIVIPTGSYFDAELAGVHASQRIKGRAEFDVRLNRMILPTREQRDLHGCLGSVRAATTVHGSDVVVVPGTTTEVVLQDPIVIPVENHQAADERR